MVHILKLNNEHDSIQLISNEKNGYVLMTIENKTLQTIVELDKKQIHDLIGILTFCKNRVK